MKAGALSGLASRRQGASSSSARRDPRRVSFHISKGRQSPAHGHRRPRQARGQCPPPARQRAVPFTKARSDLYASKTSPREVREGFLSAAGVRKLVLPTPKRRRHRVCSLMSKACRIARFAYVAARPDLEAQLGRTRLMARRKKRTRPVLCVLPPAPVGVLALAKGPLRVVEECAMPWPRSSFLLWTCGDPALQASSLNRDRSASSPSL